MTDSVKYALMFHLIAKRMKIDRMISYCCSSIVSDDGRNFFDDDDFMIGKACGCGDC